MSSAEFLLWVRGPGFGIASAIFVFGMTLRLLEIFFLGRKANLAEKRASGAGQGLRTILSRFAPPDGNTFRRSMFTVIAGYVFHVGLFVTVFLFAPHIQLVESLIGMRWPNLPSPIVDFVTVLSMVALLAILWRRITHPVVKYLSRGEDLIAWTLTFLPLLTGYLSYHHLFVPYVWMLALHILSVELLLVLFPFTKLTHALTLFASRWYTGYMAGEKGVRT